MRKDEMRRLLALERAEKACIRLLSEEGDFDGRLQSVLDICLDATGVSRVYVFENEDDPEAGICMTQICEACAEGVAPQIGNPELRHLPYAEGAPSLLPRLQARESYARVVSELEGFEREILEIQHILSVLIEPVFVGNSLWGFIGFDDCETPRAWQDKEIQILKAVADVLGMAVSRQRQRRDIERRIAFERLVAEVCSRMAQADADTMDGVVNGALDGIGRFVGADHAYLFQFRNGNARIDNTHEWCAEGIEPHIDNLQDIVLGEGYPWFARQIKQGEAVHIPRVADLPQEADRDRRRFKDQGIQSLIAVPMKTSGRLAGFLGFDAVKTEKAWVEDDRLLLQFVANTVAGALGRLRSEEHIRTLRGIVPICAWCKKIRDDKGFWNQVEAYIQAHSEAEFSHGICPDCMKKALSQGQP